MAFRLLAPAVPDPVKMEITIAYPERNIMEFSLVVIARGGGDSYMEQTGMLVGNFELNP